MVNSDNLESKNPPCEECGYRTVRVGKKGEDKFKCTNPQKHKKQVFRPNKNRHELNPETIAFLSLLYNFNKASFRTLEKLVDKFHSYGSICENINDAKLINKKYRKPLSINMELKEGYEIGHFYNYLRKKLNLPPLTNSDIKTGDKENSISEHYPKNESHWRKYHNKKKEEKEDENNENKGFYFSALSIKSIPKIKLILLYRYTHINEKLENKSTGRDMKDISYSELFENLNQEIKPYFDYAYGDSILKNSLCHRIKIKQIGIDYFDECLNFFKEGKTKSIINTPWKILQIPTNNNFLLFAMFNSPRNVQLTKKSREKKT